MLRGDRSRLSLTRRRTRVTNGYEGCGDGRVIGEKTLELDFFAGVLRRIGQSRQKKDKAGARAATPRSAVGLQSQGGLRIQRMCEMATVSRGSFYRHWKKKAPREAENNEAHYVRIRSSR